MSSGTGAWCLFGCIKWVEAHPATANSGSEAFQTTTDSFHKKLKKKLFLFKKPFDSNL
jgi:hypothetical protein